MLDSLMSILAGGGTGLLGTALTYGLDWLRSRSQHSREVELSRLDLEQARVETASAERVAAVEAASETDAAAWGALEASHRSAGQRWSRAGDPWPLLVVDVIRGLMRPMVTLGSLGFVAWLYDSMTPVMAPADLPLRVTDTALYLASSSTLWWFGTRPLRGGSGR